MIDSSLPKISIITCFLNVENYIEETIQSVLNQEYENWELMLIDDGATDKSSAIARSYHEQYPEKIIYHEHENHGNKGTSKSRNIGIEKSSGELIAFLDADDVLLPGSLLSMLELMKAHSATLLLEASEYWYDWNDATKKNEVIEVGAEQNKLYDPPQLMLDLYPIGSGAAPCICGMLVEKKAVQKHGAFDESFTGMYDDQSFLVKFYLHESVYVSNGCHNRYRQRPGSLVHSSHGMSNYHKERKYFLKWLEKYIHQQGIYFPEVKKLLQQALLPYNPVKYFFSKRLPGKIKGMIKKITAS